MVVIFNQLEGGFQFITFNAMGPHDQTWTALNLRGRARFVLVVIRVWIACPLPDCALGWIAWSFPPALGSSDRLPLAVLSSLRKPVSESNESDYLPRQHHRLATPNKMHPYRSCS